MTAHPMTRRARLLAEEYDGDWLILSLCDALDGMQRQLDAALCDMADEAAGIDGIVEVLSWHRDIAWDHKAEVAVCGDCDAPLGSMKAPMDEQEQWLRRHVAEELADAGYDAA